jgi:excisionase family DNA binding protein
MINNIETTAPATGNNATIAPLFYDIKEAAQVLNMSTKTVRRLLWRGKLTSCKFVRKVLIPRKQIEEFIKVSCDTPKLPA